MIGFKKDRNDLRIRMDEIKESGYHLSCSKDKNWIEDVFRDVKDIDFTFVDGLRIQMEILRTGSDIFASGVINTTTRLHCIKCLDDFDFPFEARFQYTLCPSDGRGLLPEMEISRKDLDVFYYQGDSVNLK